MPGGDTPLKAWARALALTAPIARNPAVTLPIQISELADAFGDKIALSGEDETMSYRVLAERSNRFTRWALEQGLVPRDVVCLVMPNCPDCLAAWLGITRTGAVAALVNTNLVGESLAHAIRVTAPKCMVVGADLAEAVAAVIPSLERAVPCWVQGAAAHGMACIDPPLGRKPALTVTGNECAAPATRALALYISTPGTHSLPQ